MVEGARLNRLGAEFADHPTYALGVLGMPGFTAWYGLLRIGEPSANETLVVAAANGAVGSVVGQTAKLRGCRVIGIAGGAEKCRFVVEELGFDAVLPLLNVHARVPVCGLIATYNATHPPAGPDRVPLLMRTLLTKRIRMQGFIITEHGEPELSAFLKEMEPWVREGKVKFREDVVDGLENAPAALIGMLKGKNFGKVLVRIAHTHGEERSS